MKAAFFIALALASAAVKAGPIIKIESPDIPHYMVRLEASKELMKMFHSIDQDAEITIKISSGYLEYQGKGLQYVSVQIPEKNIYYTYNGPDGVRKATRGR